MAAEIFGTVNHKSAVFRPDLTLGYVDAGTVFAYMNQFQTLYRGSAHLRA